MPQHRHAASVRSEPAENPRTPASPRQENARQRDNADARRRTRPHPLPEREAGDKGGRHDLEVVQQRHALRRREGEPSHEQQRRRHVERDHRGHVGDVRPLEGPSARLARVSAHTASERKAPSCRRPRRDTAAPPSCSARYRQAAPWRTVCSAHRAPPQRARRRRFVLFDRTPCAKRPPIPSRLSYGYDTVLSHGTASQTLSERLPGSLRTARDVRLP